MIEHSPPDFVNRFVHCCRSVPDNVSYCLRNECLDKPDFTSLILLKYYTLNLIDLCEKECSSSAEIKVSALYGNEMLVILGLGSFCIILALPSQSHIGY